MTRKIAGILVALVLAVFGTAALVLYVNSAEERALEGEELAEVYVVTRNVPIGTPGERIDDFVTVEQVPVKVRPENAVENLDELDNLVTAVELVPGEQLVSSRFLSGAEVIDRAVGVDVPDDKLELTVPLDQAQAVGALVEPGQTVAVFASFEPFDLAPASVVEIDGEEVALPDAIADGTGAKTPNTTDIILRGILVTAVQVIEDSTISDEDENTAQFEEAPDSVILVTLAIDPADAERVVFAAEFGTVWLAIDQPTVPITPDEIITRGNIYEDEALFE